MAQFRLNALALILLPAYAGAQLMLSPVAADEINQRFVDWSQNNPEWVQTHGSRYNYFINHPAEADRYRTEWQGWHGTHAAGNVGMHRDHHNDGRKNGDHHPHNGGEHHDAHHNGHHAAHHGGHHGGHHKK